jgi:hypothetical protein
MADNVAGAEPEKIPNMKLDELEVNRIIIKSEDKRIKMVVGRSGENGVGLVIHDRLTSNTLMVGGRDDIMAVEIFGYDKGERVGLARRNGSTYITYTDKKGCSHALCGDDIPLVIQLLKQEYGITPGSPLDLTFTFHPAIPNDLADVIQEEIRAAARLIVIKYLKLDCPVLTEADEIKQGNCTDTKAE